jgi:transcription initiation factor IIF auxiliary subunit
MARERKLTIAVNVNNDDDLPKTSVNISEFINVLEDNHGEFDLDIQVGVVETSQDGNEKVMGFLAEYEPEQSEDEEEIEEDYEEDDFNDTSRKRSNSRRTRGTTQGATPSARKHREHDRRD